MKKNYIILILLIFTNINLAANDKLKLRDLKIENINEQEIEKKFEKEIDHKKSLCETKRICISDKDGNDICTYELACSP